MSCTRCRRTLGWVESVISTNPRTSSRYDWFIDPHWRRSAAPFRWSDTPEGERSITCVCRCGLQAPTRYQGLIDAAPVAFDAGLDLVVGASRYGLP